jgi:hypothetical protein
MTGETRRAGQNLPLQETGQPYRPRAPELHDSRATGIGEEKRGKEVQTSASSRWWAHLMPWECGPPSWRVASESGRTGGGRAGEGPAAAGGMQPAAIRMDWEHRLGLGRALG